MAGKRINAINRQPSAFKLTVKTIIAVLGTLFLFLLGAAVLSLLSEEVVPYEEDLASMIDMCNRYYYERSYGNLRDELELFGLYSDDFGIYWEVCNGYELYLRVLEYRNIDGGKEQADSYEMELSQLAKNPVYEQNKRHLERMVQALFPAQ
jgi:hypothetical protein